MKIIEQNIEAIILLIVWLALLIVAIFFLPEWWNWDKIIDYLWNEPWENLLNSWQLNNYENPILEQWPYFFSLAVIGIGLFSLNYFKHLDSVLMMVVGVIMTIPIILGLVLLIINIVKLISGSFLTVLLPLFILLIIITFFTLTIQCIVSLFSQSNTTFKDDLRKAKHGDIEAQYRVAKVYYEEEKNHKEAMKWYRKAAEHGNANAQYNLGLFYAEGQVVEQDIMEAIKWYRKAAEQGNANAQYNLGLYYAEGQVVKQDFMEAVKWYRKAAEHGNANAQYNLGLYYAEGQVVEQDFMKAVKWYRKAADQGNAAAQNNLGWCFYYGQGVEQDYKEAVNWFNKAAKQVNVTSHYNNENECLLDIHYDIDAFDDYDYSQETWDAFIKGLYEDRSDDMTRGDNTK